MYIYVYIYICVYTRMLACQSGPLAPSPKLGALSPGSIRWSTLCHPRMFCRAPARPLAPGGPRLCAYMNA